MINASFVLKTLATCFSIAGFVLINPAVLAEGQGNSNAHNKVTICHATGSQSNPYVRITVNANGVVNGHHGHQSGRDIIPPFTYNDHGTSRNYPGQNWGSGQAVWNNECRVPQQTPHQGGNTGNGGNGGGAGSGGSIVSGVTTQQGGRGADASTGTVLGAQVTAPVGGVSTGYGAGGGGQAWEVGATVGFAGALALAGYSLRRLMQVE